MRARARLLVVAAALAACAACPPSLTPCDANGSCEGELVCHDIELDNAERVRLCAPGCENDGNCQDGQTCVESRCRFDDTRDAGPADGGPGDAGPVDGGATDGGPVDAGPIDGGADAGPGDAGPTDAGRDCNEASPCPTIDNGDNACVNGVCVLTCDEHFDVCAAGTCVSTETLTDCGECDNDVSQVASSCAGGIPRCGAGDAGSCAAPVGLCRPGPDAGYACFECVDDTGCADAGVCCAGACVDPDTGCGCIADPAAAELGEDCTARDSERACVDGSCGCTEGGLEQCGRSDAGPLRLCDLAANTCVPQGPGQCGAVGGVLPAPVLDAGVIDGGVCTVALGGETCAKDDDALGVCGCFDVDDCDDPVFDTDGIPHVRADRCENLTCGCHLSEDRPCPADRPDCTSTQGCVDLRNDPFNCGVAETNCLLEGTGIPTTGDCVESGCLCNAQPDCDEPQNVDLCALSGGVTRCVCNNFHAETAMVGDPLPCPAGLECFSQGCEWRGERYDTLAELTAAMQQTAP